MGVGARDITVQTSLRLCLRTGSVRVAAVCIAGKGNNELGGTEEAGRLASSPRGRSQAVQAAHGHGEPRRFNGAGGASGHPAPPGSPCPDLLPYVPLTPSHLPGAPGTPIRSLAGTGTSLAWVPRARRCPLRSLPGQVGGRSAGRTRPPLSVPRRLLPSQEQAQGPAPRLSRHLRSGCQPPV